MNELSHNIIHFVPRRDARLAALRAAATAARGCRPTIICHWTLDPVSGRPLRVWSRADRQADADAPTYICFAS